MTHQTILVTKRDRVCTITLNRPQVLNAINNQMVRDIHEVIEELRDDGAVHAVVFAAAEPGFCSGADIKEAATYTPAEQRWRSRAILDLFHEVLYFDKPTIAAINGVAVGGGLEIAASCDIRIATEDARLGFVEGKVGQPPISRRVALLIGPGRAREFFFTAELISASDALRLGLVNKVVPKGELTDAVRMMVDRIRNVAPVALKYAKAHLNFYETMDVAGVLTEFEREAVALCKSTEDRAEGITAFLEKRRPNFRGQ